MAPSRAAANIVSKNAGWLKPRNPTRSPWLTPWARSPPASRSMRSCISPYVQVVPSKVRARRWGERRARWASQLPRLTSGAGM